MPALQGKNISQINQILGKYEVARGKSVVWRAEGDPVLWDVTYRKDGRGLLVTYELDTGKVVEYFISTDYQTPTTTNTNSLLGVGNLTENDPRYTIEFVESIDTPNSYTGVNIIPTNN